jgi:hypothetical protein
MNSMQTQRMNRVKEGVQTYVNGDKLLFVFAKSNNDNCIIFMYDEEDGIVPMWLHLEPKDVEKHKKSGNLSMMSSLSSVENDLMGCDVIVDDITGKFNIVMKQNGIEKRDFELVTDSKNKPVVLSSISGSLCRLHYGYCEFKENSMIPNYFLLNGTDIKTGESKIENVPYSI